jgi:hypothetical protein
MTNSTNTNQQLKLVGAPIHGQRDFNTLKQRARCRNEVKSRTVNDCKNKIGEDITKLTNLDLILNQIQNIPSFGFSGRHQDLAERSFNMTSQLSSPRRERGSPLADKIYDNEKIELFKQRRALDEFLLT